MRDVIGCEDVCGDYNVNNLNDYIVNNIFPWLQIGFYIFYKCNNL